MITPDDEIAQAAEVLDALYDAVRGLRREIIKLKDLAQSDQDLNETELSKSMRNVHGMIGQCAKAETFLNECKRRKNGIAKGDYALDLDRARVEIGCKLDRLRRCGGAGRVSE